MVWANSPWYDSYFDLWDTEAVIAIGDHVLALDLQEWINDAAMVLFFFVAGLEIKREVTQGELRDPTQAALPIIAAFGGMVVPALIFTLLNAGSDAVEGVGHPDGDRHRHRHRESSPCSARGRRRGSSCSCWRSRSSTTSARSS